MNGAGRSADASVQVLSPLALPEGTQVGRWRVVRKVGQGGFGTVYAVREAGAPTGPCHALKLAQVPEDAGFGREAEALLRVRHPGVVRMVEAGRWEARGGGYPYLVLEYVYGEGLYRWAWLRNPTARQMAGLLLQVAEALEAAHAQGVLHRDFKGGNVVVRPDGRVVVLDWGAGLHPEATALTCTARVPPGTPLYYSPQVLRWRMGALRGGGGRYPYTEADEAYAVGVTFYRLLADEYPAPQVAMVELGAGLESLEPRPLVLLNPRVPPPFAALVMRLLAPRPEARLGRMAELAAEVRRVLKDAGAAWDEPLFEWYAGPGSRSRTTDDGGVWGPLAPGDEAALLRDRVHRPDVLADKAAERWLRRRHPQSLAAREVGGAEHGPDEAEDRLEESPPRAEEGERQPDAPAREWPLPSGANSPDSAPDGRGHSSEASRLAELENPSAAFGGRKARRGMWRSLLLVAGLAGALMLERDRAPTVSMREDVADSKVAPIAGLPHSAGAGEAPVSPPLRPPQEQPMPTPSAPLVRAPGLVSTLKRGALACGAAAAVACSGPQVRPTPGTACPDGALEAMRKLGLEEGQQVNIYVRAGKPGRPAMPLFVRDGNIVSEVFDSTSLPSGTLIEGRLWTRGETVIGRYTALELPNGRRYPVCLVLCDELGCNKYSESTEDAPAIGHAAVFKVVDVFP
ncbi:serine/threonine protein kinase [Pyxidicoccus parkwayensis]|uniref:Serine/threonine protein kinase n=1 Tax=Pyxidicoccus parkwayensis TaxID=2813578 RepID=A0ABX7P1H7_9BACT|nr:serine/threonine-protein kinase [Pyxidicoccus parkwaysis]QSQ23797.1 serine/threonine protein kinase [Pyxidicoccus parkwaysis]